MQNQQATVSFNSLFMSLFNLKKKELERDVHRAALKVEIQKKQLDILASVNPEIKLLSYKNKVKLNFGTMFLHWLII